MVDAGKTLAIPNLARSTAIKDHYNAILAETQSQGLFPWLSSRWRPTGKSLQFADPANSLNLACLPANNWSDQRSSVVLVHKLCSVVSVENVGRSSLHEMSTLGRSNVYEYCNNCMSPHTAPLGKRTLCCIASANPTDMALSSRRSVCIYNLEFEYHNDPCQIASGTPDLRGSAGGHQCYPRPASCSLRSRSHESTYAPDGIVAQVAPVRRPSDRIAPHSDLT